jgi:sugar lactone lactonase YvrE
LPGAIKLLFIDAVTGETLRSPIIFDESVASLSSSFLNDVVVDKLNNFLYITDSGLQVNASLPLQGGLLVVDLSTNQVRRLLDRHPSVQNDLSFWLTINGERVLHDSPLATGADGIALSCDASTLYYTPLSSETLYSIPTSVLRDQTMALDSIPQAVNKIGYKLGASDGFAYSSAGYLYLTDISNSAILRSRDRKFVHQADFVTEVTDPVLMQWPDTMAFDNMGSLYFVSNRLHRFQMSELNFSDVNYHIWKIPVEGRSYIFGCDPLSSRRKDSSDSDGWTMVSMPIWAFLLVIVGMLAVGMLCFWMISKLRRQAVRRRRPRSSSSSRKVRFGEEGEEETDRSNSLTRPLNQD